MKIFVVLAVLFGVIGNCLASESWLRGTPTIWPQGAEPEQLPLTSHVELPISMFESAARELRSHAAVKLPAYGASNFLRREFACTDGMQLYLVRAVFTNGSTGGYHLRRVGDALWVGHDSLGQSTGPHRSALLACLPFDPSEVYVTASGAM
ncbi:hypothetical protein [Xanthomonas cannabis]|uniref:hypothetical protein n=1 Tax=Xanthomonas cannabis TaxID=1885674 RepID=UPI00141B2EBF|nr:hypothetical protein [Xanthomonas cannabis]NIK19180.1 hypothetical protein [Xanthomonas cannabis]